MSQTLSRRDFIRVCGIGAAAAGAMLARPERISLTEPCSTATVCAECAFGCALRIKSFGRKILSVEPNAAHPLAGCPTGCRSLDRLDEMAQPSRRVLHPTQRDRRSGERFRISPTAAAAKLAEILSSYTPHQIAFVLGTFPDHLNDLVGLLAGSLGGFTVVRLPPERPPDGRITLSDAAWQIFGSPCLPIFDLSAAQMTVFFSVTGEEPWVGPHGLWPTADQTHIYLSPLPPQSEGAEWVRIRPGGEAALAAGLASAVAERRDLSSDVDFISPLDEAAALCGLSVETLKSLVERLLQAERTLAVPGALALSQANGDRAALAILRLNVALGAPGRPGGVFLPVDALLSTPAADRTASLAEAAALIERIRCGQIKALFVHGVDPLASLPEAMDLESTLTRLDRLVSFSPVEEHLSEQADLLLPDRLPLESWGYQKSPPWADRPVLSMIQPVIPAPKGTVSSGNYLLAAVQRIGGPAAQALPFEDEFGFVAQTFLRLDRSDPGCLAHRRLQGGWWTDQPLRMPPVCRSRPVETSGMGGTSAGEQGDQLRLVWGAPAEKNPVGLPTLRVHPAVLSALSLAAGRAWLSTESGALEVFVVGDIRLNAQTAALAAESPFSRLKPDSGLGKLVGRLENASGDWAPAAVSATLSAL